MFLILVEQSDAERSHSTRLESGRALVRMTFDEV